MKSNQLLSCKLALESAGFVIPDSDLSFLDQIVSKDPEWVEEFEQYYPGEPTPYLDTVEREELWEMVAVELTNGMSWPCYGDSKEYSNKFLTALRDGAVNRGWRFLPAEAEV